MELATAGAVLGVTGAIGGAFANIQSLRAQSRAANQEAKFREAEAASTRATAAAAEAADRRRTAFLLSKQRAIGAASGLDIGSGTLLETALDSAREAELSALTVRQRGELAAIGAEQEGAMAQSRSRLARRAIPGAIFGGAAQAGSVLSTWASRR